METIIETRLIPFDTTRLEMLTVGYAKNICLWYDGTLRPKLNHDATCKWSFDGQIWRHL